MELDAATKAAADAKEALAKAKADLEEAKIAARRAAAVAKTATATAARVEKAPKATNRKGKATASKTTRTAKASSQSSKAAKAPATRSKAGAKQPPTETTASGVPLKIVFKPGTLINHNKANTAVPAPKTSVVAPKMARKTGKYDTSNKENVNNSNRQVDDEVHVFNAFDICTHQICTQGGDHGDDDSNDVDGADDLAKVKVPAMCPAVGCDDIIMTVDDSTRNLFKTYNDIVETKGVASGPAVRLEMDICYHVKNQHIRHETKVYAQKKGWPTDIDFASLVPRILAMKDDLHHLIFVEGLRSKNLAQIQFDKNLKELYPNGNKLQCFVRERGKPVLVKKEARPG